MADSVTEMGWIGGYRLIRVIGRGGSGTVWEAEDGGGTHVALKLLHPSLAATEAARTRLLREARLVNRVRSSRVARVIDVEADAYTPFVVTELIEGTGLDREIARFPYTPEDAAQLGAELAEILDDIHLAGIAHRDLKPSNVILTDNGPVLIDFGIAHGEGDRHLTQTGLVTGTPGYVSPELLADPEASLAKLQGGDWFAWSALLLKAVTGRAPFGEGRPELAVRRVFEGDPDVDGLEEELAEAFRVALAPNPEERADAAWLVDVLSSGPEPTLPSSTPSATQVWPSFSPAELTGEGEAHTPLSQPTAGQDPWPAPSRPGFEQPDPSAAAINQRTVPRQWAGDGTPTLGEPIRPFEGPRPLSGVGAFLLSATLLAALAWLPALAHLTGLFVLLAIVALAQLLGAATVSAWRRKDHLSQGSRQKAWAATVGAPVRAVGAALALLPGLAGGALIFHVLTALGAVAGGAPFDLASPEVWLTEGATPGLTPLTVWVATLAGLFILWMVPSTRPARIGFSRLAELAAPRPALRFLLGLALIAVTAACAGLALYM